MKIKILNKNLAETGDYDSAKTYEIDEAPVLTDVYNETLDSATVVISNQTKKIEIEPYDIVELYDANGNSLKHMCVDTYTETMSCVNPKIYKYEITLFSETKQLEGIVLPNLKISSLRDLPTRNVYHYIKQYMSEYQPYIRIEDESLVTNQFNTDGYEIGETGQTREIVVQLTSIADFSTIPSQIRIHAYGEVNIVGGGQVSFNDESCRVLVSQITGGKWKIIFVIYLGSFSEHVSSLEEFHYSIYKSTGYRYREKWDYEWQGISNHPSLEDKFDIDCPEMQWNTPTLREVLNDLMMTADCIPILKDGKLDYLDLTETKSDVTEDSHINYVTRSQSSEDYVSELQMKLENVANNLEGSNNLVTRVEYVTLNIPDDDIVLTTNNMRLETQYPIYNLKSVKMMYPGGIRGQSPSTVVPERGWVLADIMDIYWEGESVNLIYEKNEWLTKNILYNTLYPKDLRKWPKYQNSTLYYTKGQNTIENFNNTVKYSITTQALYQKLCQLLSHQKWPSYDVDHGDYEGIYPKYYNLMFKVEYETLEGCLFRASKGDNPENERVVIDNQTNSYIDSYSQGFLEYQKANRLGNEQLQINARYLLNETPMKIGDIYEDSVIYQVQYQYFKNHIEVNALATKNYVLREYFTGVKSKIRSWKIVSGNEALVRHDLEKLYCEFSWTRHNEIQGLGNLSSKPVALYLASSIYEYEAAPLKVAFVRTVDDDVNPHPADMNIDNVEPQNSYYCMDLISRIVGNSLVFTFEFLDNYWAGQSYHTTNDYNGDIPTHGTGENKEIYIRRSDIKAGENSVNGPEIDSSSITGGGVPVYQHRYTDNNGEFFQLEAHFATHCKIVPTFYLINEDEELYINDIEPGVTWWDSGITQETQYSIFYIYQKPRVFESNFKWSGEHNYDTSKFYITSTHYKDSQEITNLSVQFEFSSDTPDILVGKEWLKKQQAINAEDNNISTLRGIFFSSSEFNVRNPNKLPRNGLFDEKYVVVHSYLSDNNLSVGMYVVYKYSGYSSESVAAQRAKDLKANKCLYINDGDATQDKVLLALNNIPDGNCFGVQVDGVWYPAYLIFMDVLRTRSKNIYSPDNHYLIVDKI